MELPIYLLHQHPAARLAASELARYLHAIGGVECRLQTIEAYTPDTGSGLWLGLGPSFPQLDLPAVADAQLDDVIAIQADGTGGIIAGSNPRSILLAAYRYLSELGCRWVRPGTEGEYLPAVDLSSATVHLIEAASYRHRGLDLAGALSYEFLLDIIAWGPKVGLNSFFLESDSCFSVLNLWYRHAGNPQKPPEQFTQEQAEACRAGMLAAIKERDLLYHAKGHGWIWEALDMPLSEFTNPLPDKIRPLVAEINGVRGLTKAGAGTTNLCYGNPEARRRFVNAVIRYAQSHPEVDYLHVWLADGVNSHCECALCRETRPADFYLEFLNELDTELTARGMDTRIVFLIYVDLLWPAEQARIAHPDRFILMFAPFYRSYSTSFADVSVDDRHPEIPPYRRNALEFTHSVQENVDFLTCWQQLFRGDSFDFDYELWLSQFDDPSGLHRAAVVHGDTQHLERLGMNGLVGCFTMRSFYPVGLAMLAFGRTLWAKDITYDALVNEYFPAAFGPDWRLCYTYLEGIGRLCDPAYLRGERETIDAAVEAALAQVPRMVEAFIPVIDRHLTLEEPCWAASWRHLRGHADITIALSRAFLARARGDFEEGKRLFAETAEVMRRREDTLFPALDTWLFSIYLDERACPELVGVI